MNKNGYIALIGLPGCGKSTLGRRLGAELDLPCVDLDDVIVRLAGKTIPELFAISEDCFRDWESRALESVSGQRVVLACGGGVVKRAENRAALRKNGFTIYVDRPVEQIVGDVDISGRPLLASGGATIYRLKEEREALYLEAADAIVPNAGTPEAALKRLRAALPTT